MDPRAANTVTGADVHAAAARIAGRVVHTPLARSHTLSEITGADVFVKFENLQFTASFKERGALNRLLLLPPGVAGVAAASAGNFAQGVAHHAAVLGLRALIVMPTNTPVSKRARTSVLGAEVVLIGDSFEDAWAGAEALAAERGYVLLSPFDDPDVIAGQGTVALEMLSDASDAGTPLEVLVVPVGGGGLLAGMAVAARAVAPEVELVGVQTERYPGVHNHVTGNRLAVGGPTIAEGIAVGRPGARTTAMIAALVDRVEVVSEACIERAVGLYLEIEKTVAEGAGAAPLAELLEHPDRHVGRRVGLVLSGGNIDLRQLASVSLRALVRSGRLTTFWVEVDDRPGSLGRLSSTVGQLDGNIVEVTHRRLELAVHTRATEVELSVETTDEAHLHRILDGLVAAGYHVSLPARHRQPWPTAPT
ncbi:MAG: threonine ammonia-lyase [Acidimicrobiales bacterium]